MLSFLFGLINPLTGIVEKIFAARMAAAQAMTDQEKIAAEERVATLQARRDVLVAEGGSRLNAFIRGMIMLPYIVYLWKLIVWDKIIMGGTTRTDDLSDNLWWIMITGVGFYFIQETAVRTAKALRR